MSAPARVTHPVVTLAAGKAVTTSQNVADLFGKLHKHVLEKIERLRADLAQEFTEPNFRLSEYTDATGRTLPAYLLTRDGFTLLAMGFTGRKALQFKLAYIDAFNRMEAALQQGPREQAAMRLASARFITTFDDDGRAHLHELGSGECVINRHDPVSVNTFLRTFLPREHVPSAAAVLSARMGSPRLPDDQEAEIKARLDRVARVFHPDGPQAADVVGAIRCLRGLDPIRGLRRDGWVVVIP